MKKNLLIATLLLLGVGSMSAKNVVKITTSCGKEAFIDTERTNIANTFDQILAIDEVLCGD